MVDDGGGGEDVSSGSFFSGVIKFSWGIGCILTASSNFVAVDSSLTTWLDFNWQPGDAGGVIDLRLNGRLKMSTSDWPRRFPSDVLLPVVSKAGYCSCTSLSFMLKLVEYSCRKIKHQLP